MPAYRILITEDDDKLREGLAVSLSSTEIIADVSESLGKTAKKLSESEYDLLILDVNLTDGNGVDFYKSVKEKNPDFDIPVIFLTVNDTELDIVTAFRLGAVDYVTKPFSLMVLRERVNSALKRYAAVKKAKSENKEIDDIFIDGIYNFNFTKYEYTVKSQPVILSSAEQKLLKVLVSNKGIIIPRERIMEYLWSCDSDFIEDNALTAAIKRLRYKLGSDCIKTVYGLGYMWSKNKADTEDF